ncbi:Uncharacterised protein [Bordetella pertussis]|nr:Uncharacterised protein [Bordetella pertussis]
MLALAVRRLDRVALEVGQAAQVEDRFLDARAGGIADE